MLAKTSRELIVIQNGCKAHLYLGREIGNGSEDKEMERINVEIEMRN